MNPSGKSRNRGTSAGGLLVSVLLQMLAGPLASAQVFASDSLKRAEGGGAILEVVCPGQVISGTESGRRTGCPKFTDFGIDGDAFKWSPVAVISGHFLSPTSEDAALSMQGCEPHSENFGGTILLTRRAQHWAMLWYKAGVDTTKCHKVQLRDRRDVLVCIGGSRAQGIVVTDLYVGDLLAPTGSLMAEDDRTNTFSL